MAKLSVIIPCYNNGNYLKEMIDCCIKQTFKDWELIIVDDQSTDKSICLILKEYASIDTRIKYVLREREPKGSVVCRNIGFDNAKGEYIIHFDADDIISDTCFEKRVKFMDEHPDCDYASFPAKIFYDGDPLPKWNGKIDFGASKGNEDLLCYFLRADYPFSVWCNIYRRKAIENITWDERVKIYTDFSFIVPCIFAGLKHKFSDLHEYDYYYRNFRKGTNMCSNFISRDKCESTVYLFDKVISEIKKQPNSTKYLKCFEEFVKLHFERLLKTNDLETINQFIDTVRPTYPELSESLCLIESKVIGHIEGHFNQARMHFYLYKAFGRPYNKRMCIHEFVKWFLRK